MRLQPPCSRSGGNNDNVQYAYEGALRAEVGADRFSWHIQVAAPGRLFWRLTKSNLRYLRNHIQKQMSHALTKTRLQISEAHQSSFTNSANKGQLAQ